MISKKRRKPNLIKNIASLNNKYFEISRVGLYFFCALLLVTTFASGYSFGKTNDTTASTQNPSGVQPTPTAQPAAPGQIAQQNLDAMVPVGPTDHIRGDINAKVVLVEYSDFQCPYCQRFHATMQQVFKDYGGKVAWVMRDFPLPFHDKAEKLAEAAECVAEAGGNTAYWKMADAIFAGTNVQLTDLAGLAQDSGVDKTKFQACLDSGKFASQIKTQLDAGAKAGIQGTPGSIIVNRNGKKDFINGALPIEQIKAQIDKLLQ